MQKLIAGNWKMNFGGSDAEVLALKLKEKITSPRCGICVCPPFTAIAAVSRVLKDTKIAIGAQNIAWADSGAFTGEVSADMLKTAGATFAIVGHSERRTYFGESDETVGKRALKALEKGITPIICVGETLSQRKDGVTEAVLKAQLEGAFLSIDKNGALNLVVAYEPVWAIGTGVTATAEEAHNTICFIRKWLIAKYGAASKILYGGSMNASNARELLSKDIDGGLIGGVSLKPDEFSEIVKIADSF